MGRKKRKRGRRILRAFCISIIALSVISVVFVYLVTYVPGIYQPLEPSDSEEVNPYLTHYLAPSFHNNIDLDRPFGVVVPQKELNEIIVDEDSLGWSWPYQIDGVTFSAPSVVFSGETILLMGTVDWAGIPVVVSISVAPKLDEDGLLALNIDKVTAGAVNITGVARYVADLIITEQLKVVERDQWLRDLQGSIRNNASFDPVFPIIGSEKRIRLTSVEVSDGKCVLGFAPVR